MFEGKLLLLNGPNLNMLGRRDPDRYGTFTLQEAVDLARETAEHYGYELEDFQTNSESELVEAVQDSLDTVDGIVINAAAYTHTSIALLDALEMCPFPVVEIHISDVYQREPFRRTSMIRPACSGQVCGLGLQSYYYGVEQLVELIGGTLEPCFSGRTDAVYHAREAAKSLE